MIYLNYLIKIVFLLVLLSIESTLTLPIFTLFFVFRSLDRLNSRDEQSFYYLLFFLLLLSLAIALFYQLTIGLSVLLIFLYYYLRSLVGNKVFIKNFQQWQITQLLLFAVLQMSIFFLSGLKINLFMSLQALLVLFLIIIKTLAINKK